MFLAILFQSRTSDIFPYLLLLVESQPILGKGGSTVDILSWRMFVRHCVLEAVFEHLMSSRHRFVGFLSSEEHTHDIPLASSDVRSLPAGRQVPLSYLGKDLAVRDPPKPGGRRWMSELGIIFYGDSFRKNRFLFPPPRQSPNPGGQRSGGVRGPRLTPGARPTSTRTRRQCRCRQPPTMSRRW